jgi:hypothetical protein
MMKMHGVNNVKFIRIQIPLTEIVNQVQIQQNKFKIDKNMELYYVYLGNKDTS